MAGMVIATQNLRTLEQTEIFQKEGAIMLSWALTFLIIALIAGLLGLTGIAGTATQIAWVLFVVFLILFLVSLVTGRRMSPK
jgi:uncharacterized membrane protein YtjA (UPF0391 family)